MLSTKCVYKSFILNIYVWRVFLTDNGLYATKFNLPTNQSPTYY